MFYLFNSGFREGYLDNVIRTLSLPIGLVNEYRYKCSGERKNISTEFFTKIKASNKHEDVYIIFIDRYNEGGYFYYPLRKGKYLGYRIEGDRLFLRVQLLDYIFPNDIVSFQDEFKKKLAPKEIPKLTNWNYNETNDGNYAVIGDNVFNSDINFLRGNEAWVNCIDSISKTSALQSTNEKQFLFLKVEVRKKDGEKVISPKLEHNNIAMKKIFNRTNGNSYYKLSNKGEFNLYITYKFPYQEKDANANTTMTIDFSEAIKSRLSNSLSVNMPCNSLVRPFSFKKYIEENSSRINLILEEKICDPQICLPIKITEAHYYWLLVILVLMLYSVGNILINLNISNFNLSSFWPIICDKWYKVLGYLIQPISIFILFKLHGKKTI